MPVRLPHVHLMGAGAMRLQYSYSYSYSYGRRYTSCAAAGAQRTTLPVRNGVGGQFATSIHANPQRGFLTRTDTLPAMFISAGEAREDSLRAPLLARASGTRVLEARNLRESALFIRCVSLPLNDRAQNGLEDMKMMHVGSSFGFAVVAGRDGFWPQTKAPSNDSLIEW